jgi:hypothetical protein
MLEDLTDGPRTAAELFVRSLEKEEAPFDGDAWFYRRLAQLGSGTSPLHVPAEGGPLPAPPPLGDDRAFAATALALTDAGRAVLAGEADRIAVVGIDRWLGGTHLRPGNVWRRDGATARVVAPSRT